MRWGCGVPQRLFGRGVAAVYFGVVELHPIALSLTFLADADYADADNGVAVAIVRRKSGGGGGCRGPAATGQEGGGGVAFNRPLSLTSFCSALPCGMPGGVPLSS